MENQPQNPEFRNNPENFHPCDLNICFGCSKELSHCEGSFEYPKRMHWLRKRENIF